jgi:hypothetical protein
MAAAAIVQCAMPGLGARTAANTGAGGSYGPGATRSLLGRSAGAPFTVIGVF